MGSALPLAGPLLVPPSARPHGATCRSTNTGSISDLALMSGWMRGRVSGKWLILPG
jgi:hypothetical protein